MQWSNATGRKRRARCGDVFDNVPVSPNAHNAKKTNNSSDKTVPYDCSDDPTNGDGMIRCSPSSYGSDCDNSIGDDEEEDVPYHTCDNFINMFGQDSQCINDMVQAVQPPDHMSWDTEYILRDAQNALDCLQVIQNGTLPIEHSAIMDVMLSMAQQLAQTLVTKNFMDVKQHEATPHVLELTAIYLNDAYTIPQGDPWKHYTSQYKQMALVTMACMRLALKWDTNGEHKNIDAWVTEYSSGNLPDGSTVRELDNDSVKKHLIAWEAALLIHLKWKVQRPTMTAMCDIIKCEVCPDLRQLFAVCYLDKGWIRYALDHDLRLVLLACITVQYPKDKDRVKIKKLAEALNMDIEVFKTNQGFVTLVNAIREKIK